MLTMKEPYLDAGMEGCIVNIARKEFWRVARWYAFEDLVQDGYLCFAKCRARYVGQTRTNSKGQACRFLPVVNPDKTARRHFMALFQRTYHNHITDLAKSRMRLDDHAASQLCGAEQTPDDFLDANLPPEQEAATLATMLVDAPAEVLQLMSILARDGLDLLHFQRRRVGRRLLRETNNEFYCRLLGLDPNKVDLVAAVQAHFGSM